MTPRLAEMSAGLHDRQASGGKRPTEVSYVLVADADPSRTAMCVESIKPFNIGVLVARDGDEAISILHRFGPPVLLIADLSLPGQDGFAVIDALREMDGGIEIIAWSGLRELREFAVHRLAGLNVRVLSASASPAALRGAVDRALRSGSSRADTSAPSAVDDIHRTMAALSDRARRLSGAAGAAVYLKAPGQSQFRAMVTWTADAPVPDSPPHIPRVVDEVLETGEALVLPDLSAHAGPGSGRSIVPEGIRGLIAVPLKTEDGEVIGAVCMFDVKPLTISEEDVDSLKSLGGVPERSPVARDRTVADERSAPMAEVEEVHQAPPPDPAEPSRPSSVTLLDRRGGDHAIARELARVRREQRQLSVILFDVDPAAGGHDGSPADDPIDLVSDTLVRAIRGSDLAIEWNRGELLVVLPGLNGAEARQVAERVRAAMQAGARHRVSVSGGVAELLANETVESAVARAHEKVRLARERGHNRVG